MTKQENVVVDSVAIAVGTTKAFMEGKQAGQSVNDALKDLQSKQEQFNGKAKELRKALRKGKKKDEPLMGNAGYAKGGVKSRQTVEKPRACPVANAIAQTLYDAEDKNGKPLYTADTVQTYLKIIRSVINDGVKFSFNKDREAKKAANASGPKTIYLDIRLKAGLTAKEAIEKVTESINKFKKLADSEEHSEVLKIAAFFQDVSEAKIK